MELLDGRVVNEHLKLQAGVLATGYPWGLSKSFDVLFRLEDGDHGYAGWEELARVKGFTVQRLDMVARANNQSRDFPWQRIGERYWQKACRYLAIDYCCLNYA